jgi:hypothetical protein
MSSQTFYIIVEKDDYEFLREYGHIPFHSDDEADARMDNWMLMQMKKRMPDELFNNKPSNMVGPHWLFVRKEDICWEFLNNDEVVLEIVKDITDCLFFDDNDWVQVANNVMNNSSYTYLAHSQEEADANENATQEQIQKSWERIFATEPDLIDSLRDEEYCGSVELRAIAPFVIKDDIKKIILSP